MRMRSERASAIAVGMLYIAATVAGVLSVGWFTRFPNGNGRHARLVADLPVSVLGRTGVHVGSRGS